VATSIITGNITNASGTALANVAVKVRLLPRPAYKTSTGAELSPTIEFTTDASGNYAMTLERTADITPANSFYEVTEYIPTRYGGAVKHIIQVGSSNTTVLASLVSTPPTPTTEVFLTQTAGDARYVQSPGSFGASGDLSVIEPDDAAAGGSLATYARSDHQHQFTTATAAALTETATSSEGVASTSARSDHVHATDVLAWGYIGRATRTSDTGALGAADITDMTLTFTAVASRRYRISWAIYGGSQVGAGVVQLNCLRSGTTIKSHVVSRSAVETPYPITSWVEDSPGAGSVTYKLTQTLPVGTPTFSYYGGATYPMEFMIEDIGT
jgi:hypothetical protein